MPDSQPSYVRASAGDRLWQGEILSGLVQVRISLETIAASVPTLNEESHPYVIVLTQDCDLQNDHDSRMAGQLSSLPSVLFCQAVERDTFRGRLPKGSDFWRRVGQNKVERYHCLPAVQADRDATNEPIEALGLDFKRYFTIPAEEVYKRCELGQCRRRCRLISPFLQQLASRFYYFQARVAVPTGIE